MTVIKICDYFLKTKLNAYDAQEIIESAIVDSIVENGEDFPFSLDDFIDEFIETHDNFEIEEDSNDWDIEFTPEEIDEIIDDAFASVSADEEDEDESEELYDDDIEDEEE